MPRTCMTSALRTVSDGWTTMIVWKWSNIISAIQIMSRGGCISKIGCTWRANMQQSFRTGILSTTPSKKVRVKGGNHFVCANLDVFGTPQHQTHFGEITTRIMLEWRSAMANWLIKSRHSAHWYCLAHQQQMTPLCREMRGKCHHICST